MIKPADFSIRRRAWNFNRAWNNKFESQFELDPDLSTRRLDIGSSPTIPTVLLWSDDALNPSLRTNEMDRKRGGSCVRLENRLLEKGRLKKDIRRRSSSPEVFILSIWLELVTTIELNIITCHDFIRFKILAKISILTKCEAFIVQWTRHKHRLPPSDLIRSYLSNVYSGSE